MPLSTLNPTTIEIPTNSFGGEIYQCKCGTMLFPTGRPGRRAVTCEDCREKAQKRTDKNRVTRCKSCQHFLPKKHTGRGRPSHYCPACLQKRREDEFEHLEHRKMTNAELLASGHCDSRCEYAEGPDCNCFCEGKYHQQGLR
jgi:hypothetical protein